MRSVLARISRRLIGFAKSVWQQATEYRIWSIGSSASGSGQHSTSCGAADTVKPKASLRALGNEGTQIVVSRRAATEQYSGIFPFQFVFGRRSRHRQSRIGTEIGRRSAARTNFLESVTQGSGTRLVLNCVRCSAA